MHSVALLLLEDGEASELASTMKLLEPVLSRHRATLGEVRRIPARDQHAGIIGEMVRGEQPALLLVVGAGAHAIVRAATDAPDASGAVTSERLLVVRSDRPKADEALIADVRQAFGALVVTPVHASLSARVVFELGRRGLLLSAAESCTGGMLGEQITSIAGSSQVFWGTLVTYSYEAKKVVLGVERETLDAHGAVSEEVVREMAAGVRRVSGSDIGVAISGVAGPGGGSEGKPVGTVWLACETNRGGARTRLLHLDGGRERVRQEAVRECLRLVLSSLD